MSVASGVSQVILCPTIQGGSVSSAIAEDEVTLYTLAGDSTYQLESVYCFVGYSGSPGGDIWIVRVRDNNGNPLCAIPTPVMDGNDGSLNLELTWMRRGNDSSQFPPLETAENAVDPAWGWFTGTLPDLVLGHQYAVTLQSIRGLIGTSAAFVIQQPVITFNDVGGGGALTALDLTPYLLPVVTG